MNMILKLVEIAVQSSGIALDSWKEPSKFKRYIKDDNSDVTTADYEISEFIMNALRKEFSSIPVVCEESIGEENEKILRKSDTFFIIDPIDGTSSFIEGSPEFTINIAFVEGGKTILGVIVVPAKNLVYYCDYEASYRANLENGQMTGKVKINVEWDCDDGVNLVHSKRKGEVESVKACLGSLGLSENSVAKVSSSLKFCMLAEGGVNFYPRFTELRKWDVAAGHAIVNRAGGSLMDKDFKEVRQYSGGNSVFEPFLCVGCKYEDFMERIYKTNSFLIEK